MPGMCYFFTRLTNISVRKSVFSSKHAEHNPFTI
jgi:hypothetical protein